MKSVIIFLSFSFLVVLELNAQNDPDKTQKVEIIKDFKYLYKYQNFYLSGQPTYEELLWFKSQGVKKIINLRSEKENNDYSETAYNEEILAKKLGFEYYSVPVEGTKDYLPEKLNVFLSLADSDEKTVIHCLTGGRATDFFMAYLIKNKGYSPNKAIEIGREIKLLFPIEKLLNTKFSMEISG